VGYVVVGALLIVAAVMGFFVMRATKKELHAMIGTETSSIPELEQLRGVSDELGARGGFRKVAEVVGAAHPRPEGLLVSEISKTECVWYGYRVDRQYERIVYRDGKRRYSKHTEKVAEFSSSQGYALVDADGRTIGVDPDGTRPEAVEQAVDRFEQGDGGGRFFTTGDNSTIGFEYKEWLIRPGSRLYVLGEVHDKIGPLVIGKPGQPGHFIISGRTEDELRADRTRKHKYLAIGVVVAFVLGLVLIVVGAVG
jgi:hypothetical protein